VFFPTKKARASANQLIALAEQKTSFFSDAFWILKGCLKSTRCYSKVSNDRNLISLFLAFLSRQMNLQIQNKIGIIIK
jgi:hypothetical protein